MNGAVCRSKTWQLLWFNMFNPTATNLAHLSMLSVFDISGLMWQCPTGLVVESTSPPRDMTLRVVRLV